MITSDLGAFRVPSIDIRRSDWRPLGCSNKESEMTEGTAIVFTEDLWEALEVLSNIQEFRNTDWYKRLESAADLATQQMALDNGVGIRH